MKLFLVNFDSFSHPLRKNSNSESSSESKPRKKRGSQLPRLVSGRQGPRIRKKGLGPSIGRRGGIPERDGDGDGMVTNPATGEDNLPAPPQAIRQAAEALVRPVQLTAEQYQSEVKASRARRAAVRTKTIAQRQKRHKHLLDTIDALSRVVEDKRELGSFGAIDTQLEYFAEPLKQSKAKDLENLVALLDKYENKLDVDSGTVSKLRKEIAQVLDIKARTNQPEDKRSIDNPERLYNDFLTVEEFLESAFEKAFIYPDGRIYPVHEHEHEHDPFQTISDGAIRVDIRRPEPVQLGTDRYVRTKQIIAAEISARPQDAGTTQEQLDTLQRLVHGMGPSELIYGIRQNAPGDDSADSENIEKAGVVISADSPTGSDISNIFSPLIKLVPSSNKSPKKQTKTPTQTTQTVDDFDDQIRALADAGNNINQIAKKLNRSVRQVRARYLALGYKPRQWKRRDDKAKLADDIARMHKGGASPAQIAKAVGLPQQVVKRILNTAAVSRKKRGLDEAGLRKRNGQIVLAIVATDGGAKAYEQVAKQFGLSVGTIKAIMVKERRAARLRNDAPIALSGNRRNEKIIELHQNGTSITDLAKQFNLQERRIKEIISGLHGRRQPMKDKKRQKRLADRRIKKNKIGELSKRGLSTREIAERTGFNREYVARTIRQSRTQSQDKKKATPLIVELYKTGKTPGEMIKLSKTDSKYKELENWTRRDISLLISEWEAGELEKAKNKGIGTYEETLKRITEMRTANILRREKLKTRKSKP